MTDFREEFQRLLESTYIPTGSNRTEMEKKLSDFLNCVFKHIPEKLYRYRQCDEKGYSLDSFNQGTIPVCIANRFSDKYDSRVFVDRERILKELKDGFNGAISNLLLKAIREKNPDLKPESAARICYDMECGLTDQEIIDKFTKEQDDFIHKIETDMKSREYRFRGSDKTAKIGCFTENVESKFMWDHYAGGYTGYALEYNLKEFICKYHSPKDIFIYVFPVIYTDLMPDVTDDESKAYMREKCQKEEWMKSWASFYFPVPLNALHMYKPYLYKDKAEYAHEREWRMICYDMENKGDFSLIPDMNCLKAIYYGPDISQDNRKELHRVATNKGIAEYDVSLDIDSRSYNLKVTPLNNK